MWLQSRWLQPLKSALLYCIFFYLLAIIFVLIDIQPIVGNVPFVRNKDHTSIMASVCKLCTRPCVLHAWRCNTLTSDVVYLLATVTDIKKKKKDGNKWKWMKILNLYTSSSGKPVVTCNIFITQLFCQGILGARHRYDLRFSYGVEI